MIKLTKEKSSLAMFSDPSLIISNEPTLNLNVYIKYGEEGKRPHPFRRKTKYFCSCSYLSVLHK